jgi:GTPase Era involved in 16S rRNA processing
MPLRQSIRVGTYLLRQKVLRREKFPLLVELEPLYACNLKCAGCGKIQQPASLLKQRMPVEQALAAIEECGAPMVSIAGGEPLMHPQIDVLVAELIREAALEGVRDELPHSIAVLVEEMGPRAGRDDLVDVYAQMYVERPSQKSIVIGAKGARLKEVGTRARHQIEALLGTKVYLDLRIKVAKDWQRDPRQLRRLGFYD